MNSRYNNLIRKFHYNNFSNSILRTNVLNSIGLNQTLYGFTKNKNNKIDTVNRQHLYLVDDNFRIKSNFAKIIDIDNLSINNYTNNFVWFYKNSFHLQFYNEYQRDINSFLHTIQPSKKDYIKYILNII
jgi:hypothetical protein